MSETFAPLSIPGDGDQLSFNENKVQGENDKGSELWKDIRKLKEKEGVSETFAPLSIPGDGDQLSFNENKV